MDEQAIYDYVHGVNAEGGGPWVRDQLHQCLADDQHISALHEKAKNGDWWSWRVLDELVKRVAQSELFSKASPALQSFINDSLSDQFNITRSRANPDRDARISFVLNALVAHGMTKSDAISTVSRALDVAEDGINYMLSHGRAAWRDLPELGE